MNDLTKPAIVISAESEEKGIEEALETLGLPRDAVDIEVETESEDGLLPGAKPEVQVSVYVRADYVAETALDCLVQILERMEIEAEITVEENKGIIFLQVDSEDASILIGRNGETLNALQYLVNRMVYTAVREAPLFIIDVQDYRGRTFKKLESLAERAVARARETGNEIELSPMPALERKFMHHLLRVETDIDTFSRGVEPNRCLVIIAKD